MRAKHGLAFAVPFLLTAAVLAQAAAVPTPTSPPKPPRRPQPHVEGFVLIAGEPADAGTTVQIEVFRSATVHYGCGEATVQEGRDRRGAIYDADIKQTPECLNPDNRYDFYVNGVHAGAQRHHFTRTSGQAYQNLAVPELALQTPADSGVKLVWIYGQVKDDEGRGVPDKTTVTAEARGAPCKGTGTTKDLYWEPKDRFGETVGKHGFYYIGVPMTPGCEDKVLIFDVWAGGTKPKSPQSAVNFSTPPYGRAMSANLVLK
jgi:hypothetical protein